MKWTLGGMLALGALLAGCSAKVECPPPGTATSWMGRAVEPHVFEHLVENQDAAGYRFEYSPRGNGTMPGHTPEEQPASISVDRLERVEGNRSLQLTAGEKFGISPG